MQLKWPMLWDLFSLFPAHAGVILRSPVSASSSFTFPRTRGGDPSGSMLKQMGYNFSPHTRG